MTRCERGVLTRLPITHQPSESHPQFLGRPCQPVVRTDRRSRRRVRDGLLAHVVLHNPSVAVFRCRNVRFQSLPRIPHGDRTNRSGALDGPSLTRRTNRSGKSRGPNTSRPLCGRYRHEEVVVDRTVPTRQYRRITDLLMPHMGGVAVVTQADLLVQFARERLGRGFVSFQASARRTPDRQPAPRVR